MTHVFIYQHITRFKEHFIIISLEKSIRIFSGRDMQIKCLVIQNKPTILSYASPPPLSLANFQNLKIGQNGLDMKIRSDMDPPI